MTEDFNWTCPYCNQPTTITFPNHDTYCHLVHIENSKMSDGYGIGYRGNIIVCPNSSCKRISFTMQLKKTNIIYGGKQRVVETPTVLNEWELLPDSHAKPQPSYIPKQISQDYIEACRIKKLSAKASATLSRRCLQGMIRDFWNIKAKSGKLYDEISELKDKIGADEWAAIDAVRSVGNIGAHMEKDVNVIIDVEPKEAELLIKLIEDLLKDWYVTKHDREERQKELIKLAKSKKDAKKPKK